MSASTGRKSWIVGVVAVSTALLSVAWSGAARAAAPTCTADAGGTGLSAAVVVTASQKITGSMIDATGCDIGIYVGAGATNVTIDGATVSGANFQGILAEKTSKLTVQNSTVDGNGFHTIDPSAPALQGSGLHSKVGQSFGISLFGVSDSTISGNKVFDNGRGGIGVMDNGPFDPGAITQNPKAPPVASTGDTITNNQVWRNYGGCAIVVATQNLGGSLANLAITRNTIVGTGMSPTNGPDIGGVVVAADPPGSSLSTVSVSGNTIDGSFEGGVIVNAIAPGSSTQAVTVTGNTLRANNFGAQEAPKTAGVIVYAPAGQNTGTVVSNNTVSDQYYGIWTYKSPQATVSGNVFGPGTTVPVSQVSTPVRVLDTRSGVGAAKAPVGAGKAITLTLSGLPAGATAAVLNLVAVDLGGAGSTFVAACPAATSTASCAKTSALNVTGPGAVANEITVPIASDRKVTLYNNAGSVDLVADLQGYLTGGFSAAGPVRVLDTRSGVGAAKAPVGAGKAITLTLSGLPAGAMAAVLNLVAVDLGGAGSTFVAACPAAVGTADCATTSALNVTGPGAIANEITVPIASDGTITLYNNAGSVDLVADLQGYLTGGFSAAGPVRVLDTRSGVGAAKAPVGAGKAITLTLSGLPAGATAAVLNLVAVDLSGAGSTFVAACPAAVGTADCATTSALNVTGPGAIANEITVPIASDGTITLYNNTGSVNLVADLQGYLTTVFAT